MIVSTGPRTEADSFNTSLQQISPATLREAVQTETGESVAITEVKFDHPIFEVFQESGRLAAANVIGYFRSEPRQNAAVLARFEDGSPALVEARTGKGRVLLFTSSLGPSWNDLPLTPLYLPFIHQMVRYAGTREESAWYGLGQTFTVSKKRKQRRPQLIRRGARGCRKAGSHQMATCWSLRASRDSIVCDITRRRALRQ